MSTYSINSVGQTPGADVSTFDTNWVKVSGYTGTVVAASGGGVVPSISSLSLYRSATIADSGSGYLEYDCNRAGTASGDFRIYWGMSIDGLNGYMVRVFSSSLSLSRIDNGTATALDGSAVSHFISDGGSKKVRLERDVATGVVRALLNGVAQKTATDTTYTAAGYAMFGAASVGTQNYTATNFAGATTGGTAATATTLSGPTSGVNGSPSTNFTAGANGTITGTVTITPSDGGGGGSFTPSSVNISNGTPTATFTYTPGSTGTKTISISDNGGLTDAATISYVVSAAPAGPTINTHPSSLSRVAPATATFTVAATTSGGSLTYQWQVNSGTGWSNVSGGSGATTTSYTTAATTTGMNGYQYRCAVTDSNGTVNSNAATLTVTSAVTYGFKFSTNPSLKFSAFVGALVDIAVEGDGANWSLWVMHDTTNAEVANGGPYAISNGRLPDFSHASLANQTYFIRGRRTDGAFFAVRIPAEVMP